MVPAHEQLATDHGAGGIHLRLHERSQLALCAGFFEVLFQRQAFLHVGLHVGFVKTDAVASQVFGAVHGGVGLAQQVFDLFAVLGEKGDADAARAAVKMGVDGVGRLQGRPHGLGRQQRAAPARFHVGGNVVDQHHKLVPPDARDGVAGAL